MLDGVFSDARHTLRFLVLVAAAVPGRRAARVSPLDALRSE
jgi:ABC-type lipoprotein release transport system permease subunit